MANLQQPDGSFQNDEWGEIDTRFSYCALNCLGLLKRLDLIDVKKAVEFGEFQSDLLLFLVVLLLIAM